jgi:hypothetical protein
MKLNEQIRGWLDALKPKPAPKPPPGQPPEKPKPAPTKLVSALYVLWHLWRQKLDPSMLTPILVVAPFLLFLAASGLLAWVALLLGFFWRVLKMVAG